MPASVTTLGGDTVFPRMVSIVPPTTRGAVDNPETDDLAAKVTALAAIMRARVVRAPHRSAALRGNASRGAALRLELAPGYAAEGYRLSVTADGATVTASTPQGLFWGGISFWQLLDAAPDRRIRHLTINDAPALAWRGAMLDSARHMQSPAFIRTFIDAMALHKLNRLHWHLVDDQGWRVEIRAYPRLTQVGAGRIPAMAAATRNRQPPEYRGYYTQREIRALVAYAAARGIEIVPEIEMPGHALSALRAYPEWGMGVAVPPGTESDWGVFPWLYNTREPTFRALETILGEIVALFPGRYIHIGGDEAVKDQWRNSAEIQAQMRTLGIADEAAMQSWFMARIERYLTTRGRIAIGWDEILDGAPNTSTVVMSWRGIDGAIIAAQAGHDAILSPAPGLYFDHVQGMHPDDPPGRGGVIDLASVLAFDPAPPALSDDQQRHILGVQANIWTEHIRTEARVAHMAFPRLSALAEVGWTGRGSRDIDGFIHRLRPQIARLRRLGLTVSDAAWRPSLAIDVTPDAAGDGPAMATATLSNQIGLPMRYRLNDGEEHDYSAPFALSPRARLQAWSLLGGRPFGRMTERRLSPDNVRDRDSRALQTCGNGVVLMLEDDDPARDPRPNYQIDILQPCWFYRAAALDGMTRVTLDVDQLPFNFQIGDLVNAIRFAPPQSAAGEFEIRRDSCDGQLLATLPLAAALARGGRGVLTASLVPTSGHHDLCIRYTARSPDPLWALGRIRLTAGPR